MRLRITITIVTTNNSISKNCRTDTNTSRKNYTLKFSINSYFFVLNSTVSSNCAKLFLCSKVFPVILMQVT